MTAEERLRQAIDAVMLLDQDGLLYVIAALQVRAAEAETARLIERLRQEKSSTPLTSLRRSRPVA